MCTAVLIDISAIQVHILSRVLMYQCACIFVCLVYIHSSKYANIFICVLSLQNSFFSLYLLNGFSNIVDTAVSFAEVAGFTHR